MIKSLVALAVFSVIASPAVAQTVSSTVPPPPAPAPAGPKMVKKVVCERVIVEETTGSRLGSAPKKCRTIEVRAPAGDDRNSSHSPERG